MKYTIFVYHYYSISTNNHYICRTLITSPMKIIQSQDEYNRYFHQDTVHPYVSVGDLSRADLTLYEPIDFNMYCVVLMDNDFGELVRNGKCVRYRAGTIFSLRPGQVDSMNLDYTQKPRGWMLAFRPELLENSGLGRDFYMFSFFQQDVYEALELSETERGIILNCFANLYAELHSPADYLTNHMLRLGIGHLLSYCKRFFERQFALRASVDSTLHSRLDILIDNYLSSGMPAQEGQPTVAWCARQLHLSANYLGDLVKRELHVTAHEYIQAKIVRAAKNLLESTSMSITEIAEELGFAYPNHFTRMFRTQTGFSPLKYRKQRG